MNQNKQKTNDNVSQPDMHETRNEEEDDDDEWWSMPGPPDHACFFVFLEISMHQCLECVKPRVFFFLPRYGCILV